jgi:hypothetical protein
MWMSSRDARAVLATIGVSSRGARRVLGSGLAGEPVRTRSAVLYDEERVQALVERPTLGFPDLVDHCPEGVFVARRQVDARLTRAEQLVHLSGGWGAVSTWRWVAMAHQIRQHGSLPFVATVSGFVVLGADVKGLLGFSELVLGPSGPWFDAVADCRIPTGPGRPWVLHLGPLAPERIAG